MRTSQSQFEIMVTFMEQHGDLSKLAVTNATGRVSSIKKWEKLTQILNNDHSGDSKTAEKWKKVWSDYKTNTKKKAARLRRTAIGIGGNPVTLTTLTDIERKVLNLIGVQEVTGLAIEADNLSQGNGTPPYIKQGIVTPEPDPFAEITECNEPDMNASSMTSLLPIKVPVSSLPLTFTMHNFQSSQHWNEPGPSNSYISSGVDEPSKIRISSQIHEVPIEPDLSGHTSHLRERPQIRRSSRRRTKPTHTEQALKEFLQGKEYWRKFKIQQHKDYMDLRREQNRIRKMEVETQREWQTIGVRVIDLLDKLVNKFCKD